MNCPICNVELKMTERQGVEIDYCPQCRGVWLDRGELDKIIERSMQGMTADAAGLRRKCGGEHHHDDDDGDYRDEHGQHGSGRRRRGGLLGDLFDFGG